MSEANLRRRLVIIGLVVVALFGGLLTRLWFLQVAGGQDLAVAAQRNGDKIVQIPAIRGRILDAQGRVLAETKAITALTVDRQHLTTSSRAKLVANLSTLLQLPPDEIDKRIDNPKYPPFQAVPIVEGVGDDVATALVEHSDEYPTAELANSFVRVYPQQTVAAHVVGYIGRVDATEYAARKADGYTPDDMIGKAGAERLFESELRGTPELERVRVNNQGVAIGSSVIRRGVPGHDVQLTVDVSAQVIAEESLQQGIDGAQANHMPANAGAVVVLDARTGSVVAMASNPTYDPNAFANGTAPDEWFDPNGPLPLFNRAMNGYAPGSTFKPITAVAQLETGVRSPFETVYDSGCFKFGNEEERCNAKKVVNGYVNLQRALTVSSDVYFYNVGNEIWTNFYRDAEGGDSKLDPADHPRGYAIQNVAKQFGFGKPTGLGLSGDQPGRVPDRQFNIALNKTNPDPTSRTWRRGDSASLAVGQGDLLVTPLQLADAYATLANGGTLFTPRLASQVLGAGVGLPPGQTAPAVRALDPQPSANGLLSPDIRADIVPGLLGAVNDTAGTAYFPFQGYTGPKIAGKTGTAQNGNKQDTSWFVGFTNPDNDPAQPQYVVLAMVEQGGFGADVAAPIARRVFEYLAGNPHPAPVHIAQTATAHD
jgi:penicillin-binding protein 2